MQTGPAKTAIFWVILAGVALFFTNLAAALTLELVGHFNIGYLPIPADDLYPEDRQVIEALLTAGGPSYVMLSPALGWSIRPSAASLSGLYRSNAQGLRAEREYASRPPTGRIRIAAFGDSFTHCDDITASQSWETRLEALDPRLEVLNFGVGGYGPDQALLRYEQDGRRFDSQVALLGFMSENINRVVNTLRAFYTPRASLPLAKPRFVARSGGALELLPNPLPTPADYRRLLDHPKDVVPALGRDDYWYHAMPHQSAWDALGFVRLAKTALFWFERGAAPWSIVKPDGVYRAGTEAMRVTEGIFARFYHDALERRSVPVIVLFPSHRDIIRFRSTGRRRYGPLADDLAARGMRVVDLLDGFKARDGRYKEGEILGHYSADENQIVAEVLREKLASMDLLSEAGVARALAGDRRAGERRHAW